MALRPFFSYYGGKWRTAPRYPAPEFDTIIEPFAGSAGFSCRYPERQVHLIDINPVVAGVWAYLISAHPDEIRELRVVVESTVDELAVCDEAKWLIGFWLNKGSVMPRKRAGAWMRSGFQPTQYWGAEIRERIARQVDAIKHWTVDCASYESAPDITATWFIDPPYDNHAGRIYPYHDVDYQTLGTWCESRRGQVVVCEAVGAGWLPFEPFLNAKALEGRRGGKVSQEGPWVSQ